MLATYQDAGAVIALASRLSAENGEASPGAVADLTLKEADQSAVWQLARLALVLHVQDVRRATVRAIEASSLPLPPQETTEERRVRWQRQREDKEARAMGRFLDRAEVLSPVLEEYRQRVTLEVTEELLASRFALGDGRSVTWGSASVEDHNQRVALLMANASGNLETAARHQIAIERIQLAGAHCLSEVAA